MEEIVSIIINENLMVGQVGTSHESKKCFMLRTELENSRNRLIIKLQIFTEV